MMPNIPDELRAAVQRCDAHNVRILDRSTADQGFFFCMTRAGVDLYPITHFTTDVNYEGLLDYSFTSQRPRGTLL